MEKERGMRVGEGRSEADGVGKRWIEGKMERDAR